MTYSCCPARNIGSTSRFFCIITKRCRESPLPVLSLFLKFAFSYVWQEKAQREGAGKTLSCLKELNTARACLSHTLCSGCWVCKPIGISISAALTSEKYSGNALISNINLNTTSPKSSIDTASQPALQPSIPVYYTANGCFAQDQGVPVYGLFA